MEMKETIYKTVYNILLEKLTDDYVAYQLKQMSEEELTSIIRTYLEPINKDFLEHYGREAEILLRINPITKTLDAEGLNVLGAACLYRSLEDIWTFYDPDNDIYEDGFLRIIQDENGKVLVIDYLKL